MTPVLLSVGFLITGPKHKVHVDTRDEVKEAIKNLLIKENTGRVEYLYDKDDVVVQELFTKWWKGTVATALIGETETCQFKPPSNWDDAYRAHILKEAVEG